jgi:hypothetical protein
MWLDELARALQASVERLPTARNQAWLSEALGVLALARGEAASAETHLSKASEGWLAMGMAYWRTELPAPGSGRSWAANATWPQSECTCGPPARYSNG